MKYYAALDVSLRSVQICVVNEAGDIHIEGQVDSEVNQIVHFLRSLDICNTLIGLKAGTLAQSLTYGLQAGGYQVVCHAQ